MNQPTRGATHNQDLAGKADPTDDDILLPSLNDGITLLDIEGDRGVPVLQSLVLDHLLLNNGPAFWIDTNGYATTTSLARIAPSQRLLDRIHVARGFTVYQHYGVVCDLPNAVKQHVQTATADHDDAASNHTPDPDAPTPPRTPSLIVAPVLDAQYRTDDTLGENHARTLQARTLAKLATYADGFDTPVLVTRTKTDDFTAPVEEAAEHYLVCEQTQMGPRFIGDEFETLVYPVEGGAYYQTTFAYWRQLLGARAEQLGVEPASPTGPPCTDETVGTGTTMDGTATTLTANPLLDAWTGIASVEGQ